MPQARAAAIDSQYLNGHHGRHETSVARSRTPEDALAQIEQMPSDQRAEVSPVWLSAGAVRERGRVDARVLDGGSS